MRRTMRIVSVVVACLATTIVSATGAAAAATRPAVPAGLPQPAGTVSGPEPVPAPPIHYAAGAVCAFAVDATFPVNQVVAYTYRDGSGRTVAQYFTGTLTGHLVRPDTGASITTDLSGKGVEVYAANGDGTLYGVGPYLAGLHAGDSPSHELARPDGISALRISASGRKTLLYASTVRNLCDDLH